MLRRKKKVGKVKENLRENLKMPFKHINAYHILMDNLKVPNGSFQ